MSGDALSQDPAELRRRIDTTKAHPARVYDVFLGGKDNYEADRNAAAAALAANPRGYLDVRHNRDFMRRAVTAMATDEGVRQFLDIGTGLPTQDNVHQIAQRIAPDTRVVYVDNDPIVLAHARALLTSGPEGRTDYIDADLADPAQILEHARKTLDFDQPIALVLAAVLHFVAEPEAYDIVRDLVDALPSGSRLVLSHLTEDLNPENIRAVQRTYTERGFTFVLRSRAEVERFFEENGLTLDEPDVVPAHHWRPDDGAPVPEQVDAAYFDSLDDIEKVRYRDINDVTDADINVYAASGRKA
ncbi:SAM-dependent methyltransferase [Streptomyces sp. SID12488]|uniref:SAM-dependent methyltransferase n=1 Tax=Streptomyces sp. SID12488 TaxID=2706040 RepID=UPI0013D9184A|nr:SAM-dependent methyltransferase [Streptomyces sp. SID12488]NEA66552.1 SAM-dependent methyltransferase [Streptomyces sp. SID12488]